MKIWEIEEGREFKEVGNPHNLYKIVGMELHIWDDKYSQFRWDDVEYNDAALKDYEYAPEKKYYLKMKPEMNVPEFGAYLNYDCERKYLFSNSCDDGTRIKTQFTEKEIKELIPPLWLTICGEPIEVEDEV